MLIVQFPYIKNACLTISIYDKMLILQIPFMKKLFILQFPYMKNVYPTISIYEKMFILQFLFMKKTLILEFFLQFSESMKLKKL